MDQKLGAQLKIFCYRLRSREGDGRELTLSCLRLGRIHGGLGSGSGSGSSSGGSCANERDDHGEDNDDAGKTADVSMTAMTPTEAGRGKEMENSPPPPFSPSATVIRFGAARLLCFAARHPERSRPVHNHNLLSASDGVPRHA